MPVFFRDQAAVLYVHVPKTGGSSIEARFLSSGYEHYFLFSKYSAMTPTMKCSPQHYHAEILESCFNLRKFELIFMTVRHPLDRILSEYKMRNSDPGSASPDMWIETTLEKYQDNPFIFDNHIRPQVEFYVEGARIFRLEDGIGSNWASDLNESLSNPLQTRSVHKLKSTTPTVPCSPTTEKLVLEFYRRDMNFFNF
ncbi:sulfotransferase family 2 domain-containing protein [Roseovarius atlanticus]|uniref:sulfotransferase family 2 domain-containing protein n=1 Tax=Roseovarius atlanticus TaxID=1641875 RepID=UPI0009E7FBAB